MVILQAKEQRSRRLGERNERESKQSTTCFFLCLKKVHDFQKPYLAERVSGDLLRQALVEEGTTMIVCLVGRERERES